MIVCASNESTAVAEKKRHQHSGEDSSSLHQFRLTSLKLGGRTYCNECDDLGRIRKRLFVVSAIAPELSSASKRLALSVVALPHNVNELGLPARAHAKVLRLPRKIADLDAPKDISLDHLNATIKYRILDRDKWQGFS